MNKTNVPKIQNIFSKIVFQMHSSLGEMTKGRNQIPSEVVFSLKSFVGVLACFSHWYLPKSRYSQVCNIDEMSLKNKERKEKNSNEEKRKKKGRKLVNHV